MAAAPAVGDTWLRIKVSLPGAAMEALQGWLHPAMHLRGVK